MQAADYAWYVKQKLNKNTEILLPTALNMVDYSMCPDCETGKQKIANTVPPEHKIDRICMMQSIFPSLLFLS